MRAAGTGSARPRRTGGHMRVSHSRWEIGCQLCRGYCIAESVERDRRATALHQVQLGATDCQMSPLAGE